MVFGVSFGGMVAQEFAIRHPQRIRRLVLACTSAGGTGGSSYPLHELMGLDAEERGSRQMELLDTRWNAVWRNAHRDQVEMITSRMGSVIPRRRGMTAPRRRWRSVESAGGPLPARHVRPARCDHLSHAGVRGSLRRHGTAGQQRVPGRAIPHARLELFDGGHLFLLQDPAAMPAVMSFLRERAAAGFRGSRPWSGWRGISPCDALGNFNARRSSSSQVQCRESLEPLVALGGQLQPHDAVVLGVALRGRSDRQSRHGPRGRPRCGGAAACSQPLRRPSALAGPYGP